MKQNRTNDSKYIFLIFLAICFFSNWWHLCQTQSPTTNQHWILPRFIFYPHANAFSQEV